MLNASWKISCLAVNGQSFLVIDGYLLNYWRHYQCLCFQANSWKDKRRWKIIWSFIAAIWAYSYGRLIVFLLLCFQRPLTSCYHRLNPKIHGQVYYPFIEPEAGQRMYQIIILSRAWPKGSGICFSSLAFSSLGAGLYFKKPEETALSVFQQ